MSFSSVGGSHHQDLLSIKQHRRIRKFFKRPIAKCKRCKECYLASAFLNNPRQPRCKGHHKYISISTIHSPADTLSDITLCKRKGDLQTREQQKTSPQNSKIYEIVSKRSAANLSISKKQHSKKQKNFEGLKRFILTTKIWNPREPTIFT